MSPVQQVGTCWNPDTDFRSQTLLGEGKSGERRRDQVTIQQETFQPRSNWCDPVHLPTNTTSSRTPRVQGPHLPAITDTGGTFCLIPHSWWNEGKKYWRRRMTGQKYFCTWIRTVIPPEDPSSRTKSKTWWKELVQEPITSRR